MKIPTDPSSKNPDRPGADSRKQSEWARSVHGEAQRVGRVRGANWDALEAAIIRNSRPSDKRQFSGGSEIQAARKTRVLGHL
jgi:hypothetical protein